MDKYFASEDFKRRLMEKCPDPQPCPFCGSKSYGVWNAMTNLQVQSNMEGVRFGEYLPCGVAICQNCGHVNLFALGKYGMLPKDGEGSDGKAK